MSKNSSNQWMGHCVCWKTFVWLRALFVSTVDDSEFATFLIFTRGHLFGQQMAQCLNLNTITHELLASAMISPLADRFCCDCNPMNIFDKSTQCKKNWEVSITAARQRGTRQCRTNLELQAVFKSAPKLLKQVVADTFSPPSQPCRLQLSLLLHRVHPLRLNLIAFFSGLALSNPSMSPNQLGQ